MTKEFTYKILSGIAIFSLVILTIYFYNQQSNYSKNLKQQDNDLLKIYTQDIIYALENDDTEMLKLTLSQIQAYPPTGYDQNDNSKELVSNYQYIIKDIINGSNKGDNEKRSESLKEVFQILSESNYLTSTIISKINEKLTAVK